MTSLTAALDREPPTTEPLKTEPPTPRSVRTSQPNTNKHVLVSRLAVASVICTPFWLPIVNDWRAWTTGLVVTLGDVPLIGFTLLAGPTTVPAITAQIKESFGRRKNSTARRNPELDHRLGQDLETPTDQHRRLDRYVAGLVCFLAALALSVAVHPDIRGIQTLWRVFAMICLGEHLIAKRVRSTTIAYSFIAITTFEAIVALWQRITHAPVGLGILGESPVPFWEFGANGFAVNGTLPHPYPLAALALIGGSAALVFGARKLIDVRVAALGAFASSLLLGLTISRSGLLSAFGIMLGAAASGLLSWRRVRQQGRLGQDRDGQDRDGQGQGRQGQVGQGQVVNRAGYAPLIRFTLLAVFVAGLAAGMLTSRDAWSNRAATQKVGSVNDMTSARGDRFSEGIGVYKLSPVFGVGPGRYVIELARHPELLHSDPADAVPAHNAALLFLAEGGIPTALALLALAIVLGRRVFALGFDGIILLSAVLPFLMLDIVFVSLPSGLFLLGVWGALVSTLGQPAHAQSTNETATS